MLFVKSKKFCKNPFPLSSYLPTFLVSYPVLCHLRRQANLANFQPGEGVHQESVVKHRDSDKLFLPGSPFTQVGYFFINLNIF